MVTPPQWYINWVEKYLDVNAENSPVNMNMFIEWWPGFRILAVNEAELQACIFAVLSMEPRPFRIADHYQAIKSLIFTERSHRERARWEARHEDIGQCILCGNTGLVRVPHPKYCNSHEWRPCYTAIGKQYYIWASVVCSCIFGRTAESNAKFRFPDEPHRRAMTLRQYEADVNKDWRNQILLQSRSRSIDEEICRKADKG